MLSACTKYGNLGYGHETWHVQVEPFNQTLTPSIPDVHTELSCEFAKLAIDSLISFFLLNIILRHMGSFVVRGPFTHKLKNINTIGSFFLFIDFDDKCRKKHFPLRKVNTLNPNGINNYFSTLYILWIDFITAQKRWYSAQLKECLQLSSVSIT